MEVDSIAETSQYEPYHLGSESFSKEKTAGLGDVSKQLQERILNYAGIVRKGSASRSITTSPKVWNQPKVARSAIPHQDKYQGSGYRDANRGIYSSGLTEGRTLYYPEQEYPEYRYQYHPNTEEYAHMYESSFLEVQHNPLSTFSIDVDTTAYSNIRRFLTQGQLPPADAVRIEEMINYFSYDYPQPGWNKPFSITTQASYCPWNPQNYLVQVGIKGKVMSSQKVPPSNLVFLIDVSGSMNQPSKLPLLKDSFRMFINQLSDNEKIAIVVYSGSASIVLDSTLGSEKWRITQAIDNLNAGGSTAGAAGIHLAYDIAQRNFIRNGNNRVILATDGDFNVGVSSNSELVRLIEDKRNNGIFLSILGFGTGNYKDAKM
ncbi:MAG: von Willebrand factor type A domain-containing protein, partial [Candidatus Omnitrophica bacterium]|nr:von Willebrand factor type A domain-containing protein [Candidatus Omnitrophota bacterium]